MSVVRKDGVATGSDLEFVLSDATVDCHGDIVEPGGWDLQRFKQNPVALWDHGKDPTIGRKPIGRWEDVRVERGKLLGRLVPVPTGPDPAVNGVITSLQSGFLRAVSVGFLPKVPPEPIDKNNPYGGQRFKKQELLETSLVAVPANPAAILQAKSLNISDETISRIFGEQAEIKQRAMVPNPGGNAVNPPVTGRSSTMTTLAQRIMDAQNELVAKKDRLVELTAAADMDVDAIAELTGQIDVEEKRVAALHAAEAKIGADAQRKSGLEAPTVLRRPLGFPQTEVKGFDLIVRGIVARGVSHFGNMPIEKVLDARYPGHEATAVVAKADQTIGTTTVSGWASELVQTAWTGFLQALVGYSIYPDLRARGIGLSFDGVGTVTIPSRTAGGAGGGFVAEGSPIRVGRITTASRTLTPKKMGVIVPFSRELAKRSTPMIEAVVRQAILEDTGSILDAALLDATAASTARPAGLLNGVSAAATGYGGGDYRAVQEDFKALLAPFIAANAADNIAVIMNSAQMLAIGLMDSPVGNPGWFQAIRDRVTLIESTRATANRLVALRASDFATALGDVPEFDISEQATIHMEDTTPLEIVSGTGPTTADPVRSLWQTATIGVRMIMDVSWTMRRAGMVQWIDTTTY